ncbi:hypothetical protein RJ641_009353, partial [Dillenia turbinata]
GQSRSTHIGLIQGPQTGGHRRPIFSSGFEPKSANSRHSTLSPPQSSFLNDLYTQDPEGLIPDSNPKSFPHSVKQQCWEKAEKIKGRDPDRWRRDPLGNILFCKLVGCSGCLCHDYDHIVPYSKGGKSTLENFQVLQATVNRSKGNKTEISKAELIQKSSYCQVSVVSNLLHVEIWTFLSCQPMAMSIVNKTLEDAASSDLFVVF